MKPTQLASFSFFFCGLFVSDNLGCLFFELGLYVGRTSLRLLDRINQHLSKSIRLGMKKKKSTAAKTQAYFFSSECDSAFGHLLENLDRAAAYSVLAVTRFPFHPSHPRSYFYQKQTTRTLPPKRICLRTAIAPLTLRFRTMAKRNFLIVSLTINSDAFFSASFWRLFLT